MSWSWRSAIAVNGAWCRWRCKNACSIKWHRCGESEVARGLNPTCSGLDPCCYLSSTWTKTDMPKTNVKSLKIVIFEAPKCTKTNFFNPFGKLTVLPQTLFNIISSVNQMLLTFLDEYLYFVPGRGVKHFDQRVCLSARISQQPQRPNSTKFSAHVTCGRGSVLIYHSAICYLLPVLWKTPCFEFWHNRP